MGVGGRLKGRRRSIVAVEKRKGSLCHGYSEIFQPRALFFLSFFLFFSSFIFNEYITARQATVAGFVGVFD